MDRKPFWWSRPLISKPARPRLLAEDQLAQEDADTRAMIGHYLHLAEKFLSPRSRSEWEDADSKIA